MPSCPPSRECPLWSPWQQAGGQRRKEARRGSRALRTEHTSPGRDLLASPHLPEGPGPALVDWSSVWSGVLFFTILLPYQRLSSVLTLQRPEEVKVPFEGALRILPCLLGVPALVCLSALRMSATRAVLGWRIPGASSGTSATSACSSVLSFPVPFFFISRRSQTLICHLYFTKTHLVYALVCVGCVCVRACVCFMQLRNC